MSNILALLSQYELLERVANYISALDLLHLASTNSQLYALIRQTEPIFDRLKSVALCDGHGLQARQNFQSIYQIQPAEYEMSRRRRAIFDEELEVRVWNLKCDSTNGLPCIKCGINVCEECRYVPREQELPFDRAGPKPHLRPSSEIQNIIAFCTRCDAMVERNLPFSTSEYCNCDQYTRWICLPCRVKEWQMNDTYFRTRTKYANEEADDTTEILAGKWEREPYNVIGFWCPCGERAPKDSPIRCSWCKRRHPDTWERGDPSFIPFFENDPCYLKLIRDRFINQIMYPRLAYTGPIFQN